LKGPSYRVAAVTGVLDLEGEPRTAGSFGFLMGLSIHLTDDQGKVARLVAEFVQKDLQ
jgi:hypothetical protein